MNLFQAAITSILAFVLLCVSASTGAAERRQWAQLTDCRYVEKTYNDGDSFHVRCGAEELVVRLYFVDAPETTLRYPDRVREQSDYFGVTLDETLRAGKQATAAAHKALQAPFVVWTRWASAAGRTRTPRYYGFVEVGGQNLAELLVRRGLARTKGVTAASPQGTPSPELRKKLQALERDAQQRRRGVWATSKSAAAKDAK